jgi:hypothetical protein
VVDPVVLVEDVEHEDVHAGEETNFRAELVLIAEVGGGHFEFGQVQPHVLEEDEGEDNEEEGNDECDDDVDVVELDEPKNHL